MLPSPQSCLTPCGPMNCTSSGSTVLRCFLEFAQTVCIELVMLINTDKSAYDEIKIPIINVKEKLYIHIVFFFILLLMLMTL